MASPPSHVQALLPDPSCLKLNSVEHQAGGRVLIAAAAFGSVAYCPACHHASHSLHSRYSRALQDLPWQGATVELRLDVRRFRCRAHDCPRVTFAETLPAVAVKYGRQTSRLSEVVRLIGYVLGGEAGSRLSNRLGMATSPDTRPQNPGAKLAKNKRSRKLRWSGQNGHSAAPPLAPSRPPNGSLFRRRRHAGPLIVS